MYLRMLTFYCFYGKVPRHCGFLSATGLTFLCITEGKGFKLQKRLGGPDEQHTEDHREDPERRHRDRSPEHHGSPDVGPPLHRRRGHGHHALLRLRRMVRKGPSGVRDISFSHGIRRRKRLPRCHRGDVERQAHLRPPRSSQAAALGRDHPTQGAAHTWPHPHPHPREGGGNAQRGDQPRPPHRWARELQPQPDQEAA